MAHALVGRMQGERHQSFLAAIKKANLLFNAWLAFLYVSPTISDFSIQTEHL